MATWSLYPKWGLPVHKSISSYGNDVTIANTYLYYDLIWWDLIWQIHVFQSTLMTFRLPLNHHWHSGGFYTHSCSWTNYNHSIAQMCCNSRHPVSYKRQVDAVLPLKTRRPAANHPSINATYSVLWGWVLLCNAFRFRALNNFIVRLIMYL